MLGTYINSKATHTPTNPSLKYGQLMYAPLLLMISLILANKSLVKYRYSAYFFVGHYFLSM